ncbi:MAG: hypothetical protein WKF92_05480 [Pyrinomonadaceae bacterium]
MNTFTSILFFIISAVVFAFNASAQDKKITREEIISLRDKAVEFLKKKPYRIEMTFEEYENRSQPTATSTTIDKIEIIYPNRQHVLSTERNANGIKKSERILIGGNAYVRNPDTSWKQDDSQSYPRYDGHGISGFRDYPVTGSIILDYKLNELVNGVSTNCYQVIRRDQASGKQGDFEPWVKEIFWFNEDGTFAKTEIELSEGFSKNLYRMLTKFAYDSTIKIKAPIK